MTSRPSFLFSQPLCGVINFKRLFFTAVASSNGVDKVVDDEKTVENNEIYDFGNANKSSDEGSKLEGPNFQEIAHVEVNMEEGYNGDLGGDDRTDWTCGGQSILR
ncbi:hypothetical protein L2E82_22838 [Cichorium intybus]|uniref:Uncharacterized protein n=1 Tax=Cichorium intybus TaxID=13427 RepID=A0ACB9DYV9_CICIN|nr:hypothetical protein L2E82_22838 [Cichorium intybus]